MSQVATVPVVGAAAVVGVAVAGAAVVVGGTVLVAGAAARVTFNVVTAGIGAVANYLRQVKQAAEQDHQAQKQLLTIKEHPTQIRDVATLETALADLGYGVKAGASSQYAGRVYRGGSLVTEDGQRRELEVTVADAEGKPLLEFEQQGDTLRAITLSDAGERLLHSAAQRYAFLRAVAALEQDNYQVVEWERKLAGGGTQTRLRRRSESDGWQEVVLTYVPKPDGEAQLDLETNGVSPTGEQNCPDVTAVLDAFGQPHSLLRRKQPAIRPQPVPPAPQIARRTQQVRHMRR